MDVKKAKELKKIIDICRKNGVIEYKDAEFQLKLTPSAPRLASKYKQKKQDLPDVDSFTDEETLFWSSNQLPEAEAI